MEPAGLLENGNIPQRKTFPHGHTVSYTLILVSATVSAVICIVFCPLHHKQATGSCWAHGSLKEESQENGMPWNWTLEHCNGIVEVKPDQNLTIKKSGRYFVYGQVICKTTEAIPFTLWLFKEPKIPLNRVVGQNNTICENTIYFGRPFFLQEGDTVYCQTNYGFTSLLAKNMTYWGLYKI